MESINLNEFTDSESVVSGSQGADGNLAGNIFAYPLWPGLPSTLFSLFGWNSRGNRVTSIDPKLNVTVLVLDGASRLIETQRQLRQLGDGTMPPAANQSFLTAGKGIIRTEMVYDGNSRLTDLIDDRGGATGYTFDQLDRQLTMTFADGSVRTNGYNTANDLIAYTDENGSVFAFTVDALGRRTATAITLASGVGGTTAQSFAYDGLSRITQAIDTVSGTSATVNFNYDSLSRTLEEGQLYGGYTRYVTHDKWTSWVPTDLTYPSTRQITSAYDFLYRRNAINETSGGALICSWQFFGPGRAVEQLLGNGIICTQMNNARTHSAVQSPVANPVWGNVSSDRLGYDGVGRMITKRFLTGGINGDSGAYDETTALLGFTTAFDRASNKYYERALHAESRSDLYQPFNPDGSLQSGYDSADRLLQYQRGILATTGGYLRQGGGSITTPITLPNTDANRIYNLDGLGNWKTTSFTPEGGSPATEVRQHNAVNQITKFGSTPVLYDHGSNIGANAAQGNGNIVNDGTRLYQFDALNRLILVNKTPGTPLPIGAYVYDAFGRRVRKTISNGGLSGDIPDGIIDYLYDRAQSVEERDGSDDSLIRQFVWGRYIDEAVQMKTFITLGGGSLAAGTYFPLQDLLYRTTALTHSTGAIVEAYDTDAYGNTLILIAPGGGSSFWDDDATQGDLPACEIIFCGYRYDPETQLYHVRARPYEPSLGRFLSRDPVGYLLALGLYEYVESSPVAYVDPFGLNHWWTGLGSALLAITGYAEPSVQNAFDEVTWDRARGTGDRFAKIVTGGAVQSIGGYTFNAADRKSADCFAECWAKKTSDAIFMGALTEFGGSPARDLIGGVAPLLPISPFSAAFGNESLFDPNTADYGAISAGVASRGLTMYGQSLGAGLLNPETVPESFKLFSPAEFEASFKGGNAARSALRGLWAESGRTVPFRDFSASQLSKLESTASKAELAETAGQIFGAASLAYELWKCYRDCECP